MIQSRNKYLQFMLVMLAAWAIALGALFVMGQTVLLYGLGKNTLFFIHGAVLVYLLCVFLVYRRWVAPLPVVTNCVTLAHRGWSVRLPWCMSENFCWVKCWTCPLSRL